jgi:PTH2 family peptidyl-tRNA hydrolase
MINLILYDLIILYLKHYHKRRDAIWKSHIRKGLQQQEQQEKNIIIMSTTTNDAQQKIDTMLRKFKNPKSSLPQVDLRNCDMQQLPQALLQQQDFYSRVTKLNLRRNPQLNIDISITHMANTIVELNIGENQLKEIPQCLSQFTHLSKLNLSENQISEIPLWMFSDECAFRDTLTFLTLELNEITTIPHQINQLKKLQQLQLHGNRIRDIPYSIIELTELYNFSISKNNLSEDALIKLRDQPNPDDDDNYLLFHHLPKMRYFGCHMNRNLKYIPQEIGNWKDLEFLCLSKCSIQYIALHAVVDNMKNLKHLMLNDNDLGDDSFLIPNTSEFISFENLKSLTEFDLRGNNRLTVLHPSLHKNIILESFPKLKKFRHSFAEVVIPNRLYIGDMNSVLKKEHMNDLKITHILSVLDEQNLPELPHDKVERIHIDILDEVDVDISQHFDHAIKFIEDALSQNPDNAVLVHCVVGKSRSASCVIAYLMKNHRMSYDQAFTYLNERRSGSIAPNEAFIKQLREYDQLLKPTENTTETVDHQTTTSNNNHHSMLQYLLDAGIEISLAKEALVISNFQLERALEYVQNKTASTMDPILLEKMYVAAESLRSEIPREELKMIIVVRDDLKMGLGKIAAQSCHGCLGAYRNIVSGTNEQHKRWLEEWEDRLEPKIAVKAKDEDELLLLEQNAKNIGLNTCVIIDAGRTQIAPNSRTVLAIGPAPTSLINQVTGKLKLL